LHAQILVGENTDGVVYGKTVLGIDRAVGNGPFFECADYLEGDLPVLSFPAGGSYCSFGETTCSVTFT
jgi:hypothetical protein